MTDKERVKAVIDAQPENATFDEILKELAIERMIERGLADYRERRTISHQEMGARIQSWRR